MPETTQQRPTQLQPLASAPATAANGRVAPPCLMVIFGASGDLTRRKLLPALYNLRRSGQLGDHFAVLGTARSPMPDEEFRELAGQGLKECDGGHPNEDDVQWLSGRLHYIALDADDEEAYPQLGARLDELDGQYQLEGNVLFY